MPMKTRLPVQFLVKPVCSLFITARFLECGSRLKVFKAKGGIDQHGKVSFEQVHSYYLKKDDKRVTHIQHVPTEEQVAVDEAYGLSFKHKYNLKYDDFSAFLQLSPAPPIPLCEFFDKESKDGPWSVQNYVGKDKKKLATRAVEIHRNWLKEQQNKSAATDLSEQFKKTLADGRAEVKKGEASKAIEAAKKALERRKSRHSSEVGGK